MKSNSLLIVTALAIVLGAQSPTGAQRESVIATDIVLRPTNHPRLPADRAQLWLVPARNRSPRFGPLADFAEAVKLNSDFPRALAILAQPALAQGTLGPYAQYYKGLAELGLGRPADARVTFHALADRMLVGYLNEGVALREAECDEALGDPSRAAAIYDRLSKMKTTAPEDVLMRLGTAAKASGDQDKAAVAFSRVYFEFPFSELAAQASDELDRLPNWGPIAAGTDRYKLEMGRAERLFAAKRYGPARASFERLRGAAQGDDRELVNLRLAESDYFLKRPRNARDGVRPYLEKASRQGEALYFHALAVRQLGDEADYRRTIRRIVDEFPDQSWAEEALNNLGTRYIVKNENDKAEATFREMYERFPSGHYAERAVWKIGWSAYRSRQYPETVRVFERAAADFPQSDYRPAWLYWSGRAHEALTETALAEARYALVATDYLNSYYGRLAMKRLDGREPGRRPAVNVTMPIDGAGPKAAEASSIAALPPNQEIVRALLSLDLYDQALEELRFAQKAWGESAVVNATIAWIYRQQGRAQTGSQQFTLYRGAINTMKRAYPQYMAAGGEALPKDVLAVIFPIAYWDLIRKHAADLDLDPYFVAALVSQESTFVADIKSSANAYGLMQLLPSTARQYARKLKLPYSPKLAASPEANIRMGTAYLADTIKKFGDLHLVLASYNAGERAVRRWVSERPGAEREEFIDDIPFPETQNYVKKILGTTEDYRRLYGREDLAEELVADAAPVVARTGSGSAKVKAAPLGAKKKAAAAPRKKNRPAPGTRRKAT